MEDIKRNVVSSSELYEYFRDMNNPEIEYKIVKDLKRTVLGKHEFKIDHKTGHNSLFNVLNAYAMYDPEISYCQGMNFIVALLLKHLKNEEDTFFCFVHVME